MPQSPTLSGYVLLMHLYGVLYCDCVRAANSYACECLKMPPIAACPATYVVSDLPSADSQNMETTYLLNILTIKNSLGVSMIESILY